MNKRACLRRHMYVIALLVLSTATAHAAIITADIVNVAGDQWRYGYTITNSSLSTLQEFRIFFKLNLFENLAVAASPADWDSLVAQPDPALPDDGFFDALSLSGGIPHNGSVGGFSVTFTWLGQNTPGVQPFEVIDPSTLGTLESGVTSLRVTAPGTAPEPASLILFGLAFLLLVHFHRRSLSPQV